MLAKEDLAYALCETLSLYQDFNLEKIVLEIDKNFVEKHHRLTMEDLESELEKLVKEKKVHKGVNGYGEKVYRRAYPEKNIFEKLKRWWVYRK